MSAATTLILSEFFQTLRHPLTDPKTGLITKVWNRQFQKLGSTVTGLVNEGGSLLGLHADRVATQVSGLPQGELWYETDRTVSYIASTAWTYIGGVMTGTRTQAPTDLGVHDAGFLFACTDFGHILRWNGAAWTFLPGDSGNGYFADFAISPDASLWAPCDGTATTYLTLGATLTTTAFTTPNLQSGGAAGTGVYRKGSAAYSSTVLTSGGVLTGAAALDPAHINVLPFFRR